MCMCLHVRVQYLVLSGGSAQLKTNSIFSLKLYLLLFSSLKLELMTMVKSIPKPWASWSKMTLFPLWSSLWLASFFFLPLCWFSLLCQVKHEQLVFLLCSPCSFSCHTLLECKCLLLLGQNCQPLSPTATLQCECFIILCHAAPPIW